MAGNDDLLGLGAIILLAGGAYFLLTSGALSGGGSQDASGFVSGGSGSGTPDPSTNPDPRDPKTGLTPAAAAKTCSQLCTLGWCTSSRLKGCTGCSKCPRSAGKVSCCQGNQCTTQLTLSACCAWRGSHGGCPSGQHGAANSGGGCNCIANSALARAFTGRVTYSQQPWHQKITRS